MKRQTILALTFSLLLFSSCGVLHKPAAGTSKTVQDKSTGTNLHPTTATEMIAEFGDIPVPAELTRNDDLSFVYEAPGVTIGVVSYNGYYKGASIAKFFRAEMPKQDWQFLNAFSEGTKYMLAFLKQGRSCMVNIEESTLSTKVTIKVGPTTGGS